MYVCMYVCIACMYVMPLLLLHLHKYQVFDHVHNISTRSKVSPQIIYKVHCSQYHYHHFRCILITLCIKLLKKWAKSWHYNYTPFALTLHAHRSGEAIYTILEFMFMYVHAACTCTCSSAPYTKECTIFTME